jgi:hypothetical protein
MPSVHPNMSFIYRFKTKEITLRRGTPLAVLDFLDKWINDSGASPTPPSHPFFETKRWTQLLGKWEWNNPKTYFIKRGDHWRLFINSDINYGSEEIDQFTDWITPFVAGHKPREFIGGYKCDGLHRWENVYIERKK